MDNAPQSKLGLRMSQPLHLAPVFACLALSGCAADVGANTVGAQVAALVGDPACAACENDYNGCVALCALRFAPGSNDLVHCRNVCSGDYGTCLDAAACSEPPSEACPAVSSTYDVHLQAVTLTGAFTFNGGVSIPWATQTAIVELRSPTLGAVELGRTHEGSYSRKVIPGRYDIVYRYVAGFLVPRNPEAVLATGVEIAAAGALNVDVPIITVSGAITSNGAPPPQSNYERGTILFRDRALQDPAAAFPAGNTHGNISVKLVPGTYDIVYRRDITTSLLPENGDAILEPNVVFAVSAIHDVNVTSVVRTGQFLIGGVPAPQSVYENGEVLLRDGATGDLVSLGQTRTRTYSKRVRPGTYDVIYRHILGDSIVPQNEFAVVAKNVNMQAAGAFDVDVPTVTVQGSVTLDGGAFPLSNYNWARFWLQQANLPENRVELGTSDQVTFTATVIPGTYDVVYADLTSTGLVPQNQWAVVSTGRVIAPLKNQAPMALPIAVTSGMVSATVTLNGQAPPNSAYERGRLYAVDARGDRVELGTTNNGGGTSARMVTGSYNIHYAHLIGDMVPENGDAVIGKKSTVPQLLPPPIDLRPAVVSGDYTLNNAPFPIAAGQTGEMMLRHPRTGDELDLGPTSDGNFSRNLLAGKYQVIYTQTAGQTVAANRGAIVGCFTLVPPQ